MLNASEGELCRVVNLDLGNVYELHMRYLGVHLKSNEIISIYALIVTAQKYFLFLAVI